VTHLGALTRLLPERDPHEGVFHYLQAILDHIDDAALTAALVVRFEIQLLTELGFGLDLENCAVNGSSSDLAYVSPKSGRAVSAEAGEEWRDKLLRLPAFLQEQAETRPALRDLNDGFALSGYFLERHVFSPRGLPLPDARQSFVAAIMRAMPDAA
jgi:DNA repair protein RecO (recombination protein O)